MATAGPDLAKVPERVRSMSWDRVCKYLVMVLAGRVFGGDVLRLLGG